MPAHLRTTFLFVAVAAACAAASSLVAQPREDGPAAAGSLAWIFDSELDLVGGLQADLPVRPRDRTHAYLSIDTATAIRRTIGELTFDLRELNYAVEIGARRRRASGGRLSLFLAQRGREMVDAPGQPYVRFVGARIESAGMRSASRGVSWSAEGGAAFDDREVSADGYAAARVTYRAASSPSSFFGRVGFDAEADALLDGGSVDADLRVGPHLRFPASPSHDATLFLHYLRGRHPLGLRLSGILVGFRYEERGPAAGSRTAPPDVRGVIAAGGGEGREAGRLRLALASPAFLKRGWVIADFDANVLTARDTGELYYFYHVGYERPVRGGLGGVFYYHRSNHQLAEPNESITSINVLEAGWETAGWDGPPSPSSSARCGRLDGRARLGWLATSSFGERRRWHVRAGSRWSLPRWRVIPFVSVEIEEGDVSRRAYALGATTAGGLGLHLEHRDDDQFFGRDRTATLLIAEHRF